MHKESTWTRGRWWLKKKIEEDGKDKTVLSPLLQGEGLILITSQKCQLNLGWHWTDVSCISPWESNNKKIAREVHLSQRKTHMSPSHVNVPCFTNLGTFKNFFTWQRQWREASLIAGDNPIMGLHSLNSTLYSLYSVIVLKRKKKWKNVSVRSEDPLCMMWKLITPRKYSFRFQSSHNLHLPPYLTSAL